jgi:hypothetical protein
VTATEFLFGILIFIQRFGSPDRNAFFDIDLPLPYALPDRFAWGV